MADSFPIPILPYLEGKIGELRMMRFWSKVDMRGPDECWEWQGGRTSGGYGRFKLASYRAVTASRVALIGNSRQEPVGMYVLHKCDNPPCCNPHHLFFGTNQDNMADKNAKGRARTGDQAGEKNPRAKLTEAQIALIVQRIRDGWNNKQIAKDLPVTHSMISLIRLGRMWRPQTEALGYVPRKAA